MSNRDQVRQFGKTEGSEYCLVSSLTIPPQCTGGGARLLKLNQCRSGGSDGHRAAARTLGLETNLQDVLDTITEKAPTLGSSSG